MEDKITTIQIYQKDKDKVAEMCKKNENYRERLKKIIDEVYKK